MKRFQSKFLRKFYLGIDRVIFKWYKDRFAAEASTKRTIVRISRADSLREKRLFRYGIDACMSGKVDFSLVWKCSFGLFTES